MVTLIVILTSVVGHFLVRYFVSPPERREAQGNPIPRVVARPVGPVLVEEQRAVRPPPPPIPSQPPLPKQPTIVRQPEVAPSLPPVRQRRSREVLSEAPPVGALAAGREHHRSKFPPPVLNQTHQVHREPEAVPEGTVQTRSVGTNTAYFDHLLHQQLHGLCWDYRLTRTGSKPALRATLSTFWEEHLANPLHTERDPSPWPWRVLHDDHLPVQNPWHPEWVGERPPRYSIR